jgi:twitching motility protein PilT
LDRTTPHDHSIIQGGRAMGMQMMDDALMSLVENGKVTPRDAYMKAINKQKFEEMIEEG